MRKSVLWTLMAAGPVAMFVVLAVDAINPGPRIDPILKLLGGGIAVASLCALALAIRRQSRPRRRGGKSARAREITSTQSSTPRGAFSGYAWIMDAGIDRGPLQALFFKSLFLLLGRLARGDGSAKYEEDRFIHSLLEGLGLTLAHRAQAARLIREGADPELPLNGIVEAFAVASADRVALQAMFLEILFELAAARGRPDHGQVRTLRAVAAGLRFPQPDFDALALRFGVVSRQDQERAQSQKNRQQRNREAARRRSPLDSDFETLGLPVDASPDQVRQAYRRLMNQYHPDKIVSRGQSAELLETGKKKTREIRAAYDRIVATGRERAGKVPGQGASA